MAFGGACESEIAERQVDAFGLKLIFKLDKSALVKTKHASGRREVAKVAHSTRWIKARDTNLSLHCAQQILQLWTNFCIPSVILRNVSHFIAAYSTCKTRLKRLRAFSTWLFLCQNVLLRSANKTSRARDGDFSHSCERININSATNELRALQRTPCSSRLC